MTERLQKAATDQITEMPRTRRGILDVAHATQNFDLDRYHPSVRLARHIEHYWIVRWDLRDRSPYTAEVLPHPAVNLAFTRERGWITGVTTGKYTYDLTGEGVVLGIQFKPGAFRAFFDRAVSAITDDVLPATEVFPSAGDDFREALLASSSNQQVVADGETILGELPPLDPNIDLVNDIIAYVRDDRTLLQVGAIAKRFDVAERTLQHLFSNYVGIGLKWVIRRYRLMDAAELADTDGVRNWTTIAHDLGYSDQSHFTNDFTKIIGRPPTDYARHVGRA
ncbi:MAG: helix-turn-helix domain-containing protein [Devosia sp.]